MTNTAPDPRKIRRTATFGLLVALVVAGTEAERHAGAGREEGGPIP